MIGTYGACVGVHFHQQKPVYAGLHSLETYGKADLYTYHQRCLAANAREKAGHKRYSPSGVHTGDVDVQIAKWCAREGEYKAEMRKRQLEADVLETASQPLDTEGIPTIEDVMGQTKQGPPILPIVAFLVIAGIGGYILYRQKK